MIVKSGILRSFSVERGSWFNRAHNWRWWPNTSCPACWNFAIVSCLNWWLLSTRSIYLLSLHFLCLTSAASIPTSTAVLRLEGIGTFLTDSHHIQSGMLVFIQIRWGYVSIGIDFWWIGLLRHNRKICVPSDLVSQIQYCFLLSDSWNEIAFLNWLLSEVALSQNLI